MPTRYNTVSLYDVCYAIKTKLTTDSVFTKVFLGIEPFKPDILATDTTVALVFPSGVHSVDADLDAESQSLLIRGEVGVQIFVQSALDELNSKQIAFQSILNAKATSVKSSLHMLDPVDGSSNPILAEPMRLKHYGGWQFGGSGDVADFDWGEMTLIFDVLYKI